jgi:hypothetical protein
MTGVQAGGTGVASTICCACTMAICMLHLPSCLLHTSCMLHVTLTTPRVMHVACEPMYDASSPRLCCMLHVAVPSYPPLVRWARVRVMLHAASHAYHIIRVQCKFELESKRRPALHVAALRSPARVLHSDTHTDTHTLAHVRTHTRTHTRTQAPTRTHTRARTQYAARSATRGTAQRCIGNAGATRGVACCNARRADRLQVRRWAPTPAGCNRRRCRRRRPTWPVRRSRSGVLPVPPAMAAAAGARACACACVRSCVRVCVRVLACMCACMCLRVRSRMRMRWCMRTCLGTGARIRARSWSVACAVAWPVVLFAVRRVRGEFACAVVYSSGVRSRSRVCVFVAAPCGLVCLFACLRRPIRVRAQASSSGASSTATSARPARRASPTKRSVPSRRKSPARAGPAERATLKRPAGAIGTCSAQFPSTRTRLAALSCMSNCFARSVQQVCTCV